MKDMRRVAIITASDSGYQGEREDLSGPEIQRIIENNGYETVYYRILPDDRVILRDAMIQLADDAKADLILTTGGTGFSPRDCMPEATADVIERAVPGIPEAMRFNGLQFTRRAMLSRATAGIRKQTLIINLPGSPKAVRQCLRYIMPELGHGIKVLQDEITNCAQR